MSFTITYYLALLRRIGCTGDAHDLNMTFGDDALTVAAPVESADAR
jgi:hypothetical protein